MDREQINCYLWVGRLVYPLQLPPWEGKGEIKLQVFYLWGNTIAVKGMEP
jgi:hypothetical protein